MPEPLIFEKSREGRKSYSLPKLEIPEQKLNALIPEEHIRTKPARLPEISELELMRHFVQLSNMNHNIEKGFYPLGSCTMKYNPKINEDVAILEGFSMLHPLQPEDTVQGALELIYNLEEYLSEIAGLDATTLQPAAGAHGELTGLMMIRAYHIAKGNKRKKIIIPDSAHGTNPASVSIAGYDVIQLDSDENGLVSLEKLASILDEDVAAFMLTNPNTLGLFETNILKISEMVHNVGAIMYMDGANMNAMLGLVRPGDIGFDVVHFNLHKTFSTPHGGGGPGAGPVAIRKQLIPFLPYPIIEKNENNYSLKYDCPESIGKILSFYGNFGVMVKAYTYIRRLGAEGLRRVSEYAIINANYLQENLKDAYYLPYDRYCQHEFVLSGTLQKKMGVRTLDIAKRLLDLGFHAPTIYFPLIVKEALMIEPTETESKETLDNFISAMLQIAKETEEEAELIVKAPYNTPVRRLDEAYAAKNLDISYQF